MEEILGIIIILAIIGIVIVGAVCLEAVLIWWVWNTLIWGFFHVLGAMTFVQAIALSIGISLVLNGLTFMLGGAFKRGSK